MHVSNINCSGFLSVCNLISSPESPVWTDQDHWHNARLSGIGQRLQFDYVIPRDLSVSEDFFSTDEMTMEVHLMKSNFEEDYPTVQTDESCPVWGYPIQCSCLKVLSVAHLRTGNPLDIQALFDLCRSQPIQQNALNWGHDYGGFIGWLDDPEDMFPTEDPWLFMNFIVGRAFQYDPYNDPWLDDVFGQENGTPEELLECQGQSFIACFGASDTSDPFSILPLELLVDILISLPSEDVANLRKASRCFACLRLPNKFWRSRFLPNREFSHIFEADKCPPNSGIWKTLYDGTKLLRHHLSVINRKRIWALASDMCNLLTQRAASPICHGVAWKTMFEPQGIADPFQWEVVASGISSPTDYFHSGSRAISERTLHLPESISKIIISLAYINGRSYVSGISFTSNDHQKLDIGYIRPDQQYEVCWEKCQQDAVSIRGFHAAVDPRGIRGLSVLSSTGFSKWVGDYNDVPKRLLKLASSNETSPPIKNIKASFDVRNNIHLLFLLGSSNAYLLE